MNRRKFLAYTLGTGAVVTTGLLSLSFQGTLLISPPQNLAVFTQREYSILHYVADILIPANPPFPPASQFDIALKVDSVIAQTAPEQQDQFKLVLALIENPSLSTLMSFQTKPFTQSTPQEQVERIERWRTGPDQLRSAFKALNGMCNAAYYSLPTIEALIGYDGPPNFIKEIRKTKGYQ